jgi:hypothetical protein
MLSFIIRILVIIVVVNLIFRWLRGVFQEKTPKVGPTKGAEPQQPFNRSDIIDVNYTEIPPEESKKNSP